MKVLYVSNIPAPYTVDFLTELSKYLEIDAVFEKSKSSERNSKWTRKANSKYKTILLKGIPYKVDQSFAPHIIFRNFKKYDRIIITNFFTATGILLISYLNLLKIPYILMSEGGFPRVESKIKYKFKSFVISNSIRCLSGSSLGTEFFIYYGKERDKIFKYPFTSISKSEIIKLGDIQSDIKNRIKKNIGFENKKIIISVGQMIHRKGHDVLLKAFALQENKLDLTLLIIGGPPSNELLDLKNELGLKNVFFYDFLDKEELHSYYRASDIFILATREDEYGLVVNEAMANGLPIITTNRCGAGIELIDNDINGYITNIDDIDGLASKMSHIIGNDTIRKKMVSANINKIQVYSIEKMAESVFDAITSLEVV